MSRATTKFGDFAVHIDWQIAKNGLKFKAIRKDRKIVAVLRDIEGKHLCAIPKRAEDFVLSKGRVTIARDMVGVLMCLGRPNLQVEVSNGDTYFATYADFEKNRYSDPEGSSRYWYVDAEHWAFTKGKPESIEQSMKVGKWK